jgi:uncharacterized protein YaaR (DUF327 family)
MTHSEIKKYSIEDILDVLVDLGKKLSNNDILTQCDFYKGKNLTTEFHKNLFYYWVIKVIDSNHMEFEKRLRSKKIKKINLNLDRTDY